MMDFDSSKDYYKTLGIDPKSTDKQIKIAYHQLAKKYHPDLNDGKTTDTFKEMSAAYDILSDPTKRKLYDESRSVFNNQSSHNAYNSSGQGHDNQGSEYYERFYRATRSQDESSNKTSTNFNKAYSKGRTTYSFRDPKTGEQKTYTFEGDAKGNPFFKDFEDFMKKFNNNWDRPGNKRSNSNFNQNNDFNNFNNYNNNNDPNNFSKKQDEKQEFNKGGFHDPYSSFRGDPNQRRNNWNPNWHDPDYYNYLYAKKYFTFFLIFTFLIFLYTFNARRRREIYYIPEDMPYEFSPMNPNHDHSYNRVPYPPTNLNTIPPAYNKPKPYIADFNDPYVNPAHPAYKR